MKGWIGWGVVVVLVAHGCRDDGTCPSEGFVAECLGGPCQAYGRCAWRASCVCALDRDPYTGEQVCDCRGPGGFPTDCCVPASDADCHNSDGCAEYGACTLSALDEVCLPGSDADCRNSDACASLGECTFSNGDCVQGSDADCRSSSGCTDFGYCTLLGVDGAASCGPGSDADCANSMPCTQDGTGCTLSTDAGACNIINQFAPCCV